MHRYCFGSVTVDVTDGFTMTRLPDGGLVTADHAEQAGQARLAEDLGYDSAEAMNRQHDLVHSLIASLLGLDASPTLKPVASGKHWQHWREEEAAVFALCRFAHCAGVDLTAIAGRQSNGPTDNA